jgi:hypothetical protein
VTTDPLNLAAFAVFTFCVLVLVGGVRFVRYLLTVKESAMHGNLSRTPARQAVHIHNARLARDLMHPVRPSVSIADDDGDPLDFTFAAVDVATRAAAPKRIAWAAMTLAEIERVHNEMPTDRSRKALCKRRRQVARRGGR